MSFWKVLRPEDPKSDRKVTQSGKMDWRLLDYAKEAEDTASGLHIFLGEIPQYSKDITGDIAELFAISNALHVLHEGLEMSRYGRYSARIMKDLEIVLPSLGLTLDNVRDMFSRSKKNSRQAPGAFPGTPPYDIIWEDALADMKRQGIALPLRLELYRSYLQGMMDILKGDPVDEDVDVARLRLQKLLKKQEPIEEYFDRLNVNPHGRKYGEPARTPAPRPPANPRPSIRTFQTYPAYEHPPPPPPPPPLPLPPLPHRQPIYSDHAPVYGEIPFIPPPVAEVPNSPTYSSASSQTFSTHSNDSGSSVAHWAMKIYDGRHSSTPFQTLGQPTKCLGRDESQAIEFLEADGFIKVLELPFEATNVWVRIYWRASDQRARILFLTLSSDRQRMRYCFPLTGLKVLRTESCLQLCRVNRQDGQLDLWANLRFTLYERMVLFYCTLVAMKVQDQVTITPGLDDFFQPGEKEEFGGEIQDSTYLHAFRVFRDKDSGGVRFEARARRGPLKTIPIWTAFVTQYIGQRKWMRRIGHTTVQFRQLHPYVFCDGYSPPRGQSGKYQLTFTTPEDSRHFMEMFHHIKTR